MKRSLAGRPVLAAAAVLLGVASKLLAVCGPFTDVTDAVFCPFVLEIFTLGITTGTTATTYDPNGNVTRIQMAAFLSRTVDATLKRATRRAAVNQLWTPKNEFTIGLTTLGSSPQFVQFDGADLWDPTDNSVSRIRASDAKFAQNQRQRRRRLSLEGCGPHATGLRRDGHLHAPRGRRERRDPLLDHPPTAGKLARF